MHGSRITNSQPSGEISVLVVEDEKVSRHALTSLLKACGYNADAVETGEEALKHIGRHPPAVALVDVDLPGMSGLELAAKLEKQNPNVYVVLITAAGGDRIARFRQDHTVSYLRKPLDFPYLLSMLSDQQSRASA